MSLKFECERFKTLLQPTGDEKIYVDDVSDNLIFSTGKLGFVVTQVALMDRDRSDLDRQVRRDWEALKAMV